jgi:E3 ubiquitin-protein ligase SHPRH
MELQQASLSKLMGRGDIAGEAVDKQDLWKCLFGHVQRAAEGQSRERLMNNPAVRGFLASEAAEARRIAGEGEGSVERAS